MDPDQTQLGAPVMPLDADPDQTRVGVGSPLPVEVDDDRTRLGTASRPAALDEDQTRLGTSPPIDSDVTQLATHDRQRQDTAGTGARGGIGLEQSGPLVLGQAFGGRYHIVRLLGLGGMGAVYQAWDDALAVVVALKVIRPEIAGDPEAAQAIERRFKQELLLARQVTHKNVVRIHDLGEIRGIKYITRPFIDGEDLATILERDGPLPFPRVLKIARSFISGLVAAHEAGIVHRDLKPANIMIDAEGEALITDFGIARSTGAPASAPADVMPKHGTNPGSVAAHTVLGAVVGTVGYMAPEQAKAQPVDQRADIYSTGLILYDMLGGRVRIERAENAVAELMGRTTAAPPLLRTFNPDVPETIDKIINRCLQPDAAARYQTTAELAADLDRLDETGKMRRISRALTTRLVTTVVSIFIVLITLTWWLARGTPPKVQPAPVSVLIADFQNTTGEPVFTGAVEQALSISMEGASFISAYSRPKAKQVAEQLKAGAALDAPMAQLVANREALNFVLAGSIERDGSKYVISARALDVTQQSGEPRVVAQSKITARNRDDVLAATGRLAAALREKLGDTDVSTEQQKPSETFTAASLDAMRAYARGQDLQVAGKLPDALAAYQEAVSLDQGFGRAYAGMGVIYGNLRQHAKAEESYQQALKHTDRMTEREKYGTLGAYYLQVSHDYDKAVENYEALVTRYPGDRGGHGTLAYAYLNRHEMDKALSEVRKALDLEPGNVLQRMNYAMYALYAGEFATAIAESKKIPDKSDFYPYALLTEGRAMAASGDVTSARDAFSQLDALGSDGASLALIARADLAMYEGRYAQALDLLRAQPAKGVTLPPFQLARRNVMIAEALQALGKKKEAAAAALQATKAAQEDEILIPSALVLGAAGQHAAAEAIARDLDNRLLPQSRAYARLISADLALNDKRLPAALDALREGKQRLDSWFVHLLLGRTYLEAGQAPEAQQELELCLKRQGEVTDVFFADSATLRYLPPVHYWLARAQQMLGNAGARQHYEWYVKIRGETDAVDPLLIDARARLAELQKSGR